MFLISSAYAAEGAPAQGGDMSMLIVLTVCMVAVYFFIMRPNSKKRKEMQNLLNGLAVGDEVLTNGGIAGRINKLPDNKEYVLIEVGGITMQIKRNYVVAVLPKGTLVATAVTGGSEGGRKRRRNASAREETRDSESIAEKALSLPENTETDKAQDQPEEKAAEPAAAETAAETGADKAADEASRTKA